MNVFDNIEAGKYNNKLRYDIDKFVMDEDMTVRQNRERKEAHEVARRQQRKLYSEETARLDDIFRSDLEEEHGVIGHPKAEKLFAMAWERGYSSGHYDVANCYADLLELIR